MIEIQMYYQNGSKRGRPVNGRLSADAYCHTESVQAENGLMLRLADVIPEESGKQTITAYVDAALLGG
ncbi:MAG: hypothetical protein KC877_02240 [Candidatus Kaiserbacteria bacterium]|nr:hypothetical protein [Candidatus Kaiserbacteria bacterium]MCB9816762.1 hypothetical protein [Candidatus Nomurabacteria bacterium]